MAASPAQPDADGDAAADTYSYGLPAAVHNADAATERDPDADGLPAAIDNADAAAERDPNDIMKAFFILLPSSLILAFGAIAQTPTPPPLKPFTLFWDASPPAQNVLYYNVYRRPLGTTTYAYVASVYVPAPATYPLPPNETAGTIYAVSASNGAQESVRSSDAVVPPAPTAPGGIKIAGETGGMVNISTRAQVSAGDDAMIAGFILASEEEVAVRAIGPSLGQFGLAALSEASVELHDASGALIAANDGWETGPDADQLRDQNPGSVLGEGIGAYSDPRPRRLHRDRARRGGRDRRWAGRGLSADAEMKPAVERNVPAPAPAYVAFMEAGQHFALAERQVARFPASVKIAHYYEAAAERLLDAAVCFFGVTGRARSD